MTYSRLPLNVSPKIAYLLLSAIITWALTRYAVTLDAEASGALSLLVGSLVGYRASPGDVVEEMGPASDDLLNEATGGELP